jgi:hypothetical protein
MSTPAGGSGVGPTAPSTVTAAEAAIRWYIACSRRRYGTR